MKETNHEVIELRDESMSSETFSQISIDCLVHQECCNFLKREVFQFKLDVRSYCHICPIAEKYDRREFRKVAEKQMALNYQNICENGEFLTHTSTEKLVSFLCRDLDDLTAPSETFVFKSMMKWIN